MWSPRGSCIKFTTICLIGVDFREGGKSEYQEKTLGAQTSTVGTRTCMTRDTPDLAWLFSVARNTMR